MKNTCHLELDNKQHSMIIHFLNNFRYNSIKQVKYTNTVDEHTYKHN